MSNRLNDIIRFYELLDILKSKVGGVRYLKDCDGRMQWAQRGVYFFMEESEKRSDSGNGLRVVRVGTHAVSAGSQTTLWKRLSQHKGVASTGGGNHRGSVFRKLVGTAILSSTNSECETWHIKKTASREIRQAEQPLEKKVSGVMGAMPFLWVAIDDPASRDSLRGFIERNSIALLSNWHKPAIDQPSPAWLGVYCDGEKVRGSGLWNQNHTAEDYDPEFLKIFATLINDMETM